MEKMILNIQMFSSTNKTTYYELPQFVGTDKPSWLTDFNSAMSTIDNVVHTNEETMAEVTQIAQDAYSGAEATYEQLEYLRSEVYNMSGDISNAQSTADSASQDASSALSMANTAYTTATTADGKADTNATNITALGTRVTAVEGDISKFNFDTFTSISTSDCTTSNVASGFTISGLTLATKNGDNSMFKLYGQVAGVLTNSSAEGYIAFNSPLRPTTDITINGAGIVSFEQTGIVALRMASFVVKTNGQIRITIPPYGSSSTEIKRVMLTASLYFVKDFGDTPIVS